MNPAAKVDNEYTVRYSTRMVKESHTVAEQSDNRARILQHALRLFVAQGYDAVGVQAICDAAGITKPTLYHYFGNKRGLLEAIMDTWGAPFLRELATVAAYDGDLQYRLLLVVQTFFGFAQQHPQVYRLLLASWFAATQNEVYDVSAAIHTEQQQVLEGLFTSATPDHGNMRTRQRIYAATLLGTINTYVVLWLNGHARLDTQSAQAAVQQFSYGIYS